MFRQPWLLRANRRAQLPDEGRETLRLTNGSERAKRDRLHIAVMVVKRSHKKFPAFVVPDAAQVFRASCRCEEPQKAYSPHCVFPKATAAAWFLAVRSLHPVLPNADKTEIFSQPSKRRLQLRIRRFLDQNLLHRAPIAGLDKTLEFSESLFVFKGVIEKTP